MSETQPQEPADLRAAYDTLKAEHTALQAEHTNFKAQTVFKEVGLSAKHAELYLAANPNKDISVETVKAFADEYGLQPAPAAPPEPPPSHLPADGAPPAVERSLSDGPQPIPQNPGLANMASAAGSPQATMGEAQPAKMEWKEFQALMESNPSAAAQAYAEGRVERHERNVQADQLQERGIIR